jgi:hypothetical protein
MSAGVIAYIKLQAPNCCTAAVCKLSFMRA